jgi:hypothetical protein
MALLLERKASLLEDNVWLLESKASLFEDNVWLLESEASLLEDNVWLLESKASLFEDNARLFVGEASLLEDKASFALGRATVVFFRTPFVEVRAALGPIEAAPARVQETLRRAGAAFAKRNGALEEDNGARGAGVDVLDLALPGVTRRYRAEGNHRMRESERSPLYFVRATQRRSDILGSLPSRRLPGPRRRRSGTAFFSHEGALRG